LYQIGGAGADPATRDSQTWGDDHAGSSGVGRSPAGPWLERDPGKAEKSEEYQMRTFEKENKSRLQRVWRFIT
jgi:hypothetical protein